MTFRVTIISLFPDAFPGPLGLSCCGRALAAGLWELDAVDLRDFGVGRRRDTDAPPVGGGAGMVLRADVAAAALDSVKPQGRPRLFPSPRGKRLDQQQARKMAQGPGLILLCGRFEGLDQRAIETRNLTEISIGDFIISGGEIAAMAIIDACIRLLPGVAGNPDSMREESFENGLLEYPHYAKPIDFEGHPVPAVLRSGDHAAIAHWRRLQAKTLTQQRRPDLYPNDGDAPDQT